MQIPSNHQEFVRVVEGHFGEIKVISVNDKPANHAESKESIPDNLPRNGEKVVYKLWDTAKNQFVVHHKHSDWASPLAARTACIHNTYTNEDRYKVFSYRARYELDA